MTIVRTFEYERNSWENSPLYVSIVSVFVLRNGAGGYFLLVFLDLLGLGDVCYC